MDRTGFRDLIGRFGVKEPECCQSVNENNNCFDLHSLGWNRKVVADLGGGVGYHSHGQ